jgi:hypothetical protein
LINVFLLSRDVLRKGRKEFNRAERGIVELGRYRCYLLGLPEELLEDTPQGVVDMWMTRAATLRAGFDDATCGALVRATMAAELPMGDDLVGRVQTRIEKSFAKLFFTQNFANNDRAAAKRVGIDVSYFDYILATATALILTAQMQAYQLASHIPVLKDAADQRLIQKLLVQLGRYGHPEYQSHAERYRPVQLVAAQ